ncbi:replication protein A 70 kDa DNA-binding subunit D-like isoform X2 [Tripterygium wilfordii]|nr:replication protein A 70 kDa DNA-binding subunit D-like isoform X2 [Tripterygium wilfordii]
MSIQGSIRQEDAHHMKELLIEGKIYTLTNFIVGAAKKSYRVSDHKNIVCVGTWTIIREVYEPETTIPMNYFHFVDDNILESRLYNDVQLTDVMGFLISVSQMTNTQANGRMVPKKNLIIQTTRNKTIPITLWGDVAEAFHEEDALELATEDTVIIILSSMTVKAFRADTTLSSTSATKIYLNMKIEEVDIFRKSFKCTKKLSFVNQSLNSMLDITTNREAKNNTVSELLSLDRTADKGKIYLCVATIAEIDASKGWWYNACPKCKVLELTHNVEALHIVDMEKPRTEASMGFSAAGSTDSQNNAEDDLISHSANKRTRGTMESEEKICNDNSINAEQCPSISKGKRKMS